MDLRAKAFSAKTRTIRRRSGRLFDELMRNQNLSSDELTRLQDLRSCSMAAHAAEHSPFYESFYRSAGLLPGDLADPTSWESVPILERPDVKEHSADFWSTEAAPGNIRESRTGGTTGAPVSIGQDTRVDLSALSWRMYSWWGVAPSDNAAHIGRWGVGRWGNLRHAVSWWPTRQIYLDAGLFDRESVSEFVRQVRRTRPRMIEGFVGAILEVAEIIAREDLPLPPLVAVGTTAAPLTSPVRKRLEDVFGAPVYDQYRSAEVPWMAGECAEQNGLHVFSDMRRIEVVGPDDEILPPGEVGDLVVTDLANRVFPMVRYRIGDRGMLLSGQCPCGVSFPRIGPPDGRITDVIRLPDGAVIAHRLTAIFSADPDAVRMFQIHQRSDYSIVLRVVLSDREGAASSVERAADSLRERVAGRVPITIEHVDELPSSRGKISYIISDVPAPAP